ncbi:MAG: (d)CMP kinase [Muribaculaceae bacterium]|nr:(d)CMP kinase [Muribaculaceae bacterium]
MKKITVAIDGYSSSGKSTMARELAKRVGYVYVDSGAMYRAVTLYALEHGMIQDGKIDVAKLVSSLGDIRIKFAPAGADGRQHTLLNGRDVEKEIRDMAVSSMVSPIAEIGEVREHLVKLQQDMGKGKGIVMDGRDIGSTVFPDAEMKVFVEASPEERARRRQLEMKGNGEDVSYEDILANIRERDHIDTTRKISPLRRAADAHVLDNDRMSHEEQMDWLLNLFNVISHE